MRSVLKLQVILWLEKEHCRDVPYNDFLASTIYRESDLLLQIVPYRSPFPSEPMSNRLISAPEGPCSETKSATAKVTSSARLLLDKWTASGSAPVTDLLNEEAIKEQVKALVNWLARRVGLC